MEPRARVELATRRLSIGLRFPILFVFCAFSLGTSLLFWALVAELATKFIRDDGFVLDELSYHLVMRTPATPSSHSFPA